MDERHAHPWDLPPQAAIELQARLRGAVIREDDLGHVQRVAGVDVSYDRKRGQAYAAVVVLALPSLEPLEQATARVRTTFPYLPGLLAFRELPALMEALEGLRTPPGLILCDGHGLAHPRRFGLACHLGVLSGTPTIGVAKRKLIGEHAPLPRERGAWQPLTEQGETIGAALRSRPGTRPVYVSIGHRVCLETAIEYTLRCTRRYRLPETTRAAHKLANQARMEDLYSGWGSQSSRQ